MSFIKILAIATLCLIITIALYGPHKFLEQLWGNPDMGYVEIKSLSPIKKPNTALACPINYCKERSADISTGTYAKTVEKLREEIIDYFSKDKDAKIVGDHKDRLSMRFVTYSPVMRFPDTIQVQLITIDKNTSTLAIFARAKIGRNDFGANKTRIENILAAIKQYETP